MSDQTYHNLRDQKTLSYLQLLTIQIDYFMELILIENQIIQDFGRGLFHT